MKLDKQLKKALGVRSPGFDDLRMLGLTGGQVKLAMNRFDGPVQPNLREHEKGKVKPNQIHKYSEPRKENGVMIASKPLKNKPYNSGVYFPVEEETVIEAGVSGQPGEEYVNLSPEIWDGKKVNMSGTQSVRNHGGFRGVKPRKGWKRYAALSGRCGVRDLRCYSLCFE